MGLNPRRSDPVETGTLIQTGILVLDILGSLVVSCWRQSTIIVSINDSQQQLNQSICTTVVNDRLQCVSDGAQITIIVSLLSFVTYAINCFQGAETQVFNPSSPSLSFHGYCFSVILVFKNLNQTVNPG